jgi:hypothetical protein
VVLGWKIWFASLLQKMRACHLSHYAACGIFVALIHMLGAGLHESVSWIVSTDSSKV